MKKNISILLVILLLVSVAALPLDTKATTLKEYEDAVEKYTKELQEKEAKIAKSKEEVEQVKKNIANIEKQISDAEIKMKELQEEIDKSNQEIKDKTEESKSIIEYYQISNGENSYLAYIFGATDITDMVYRMSVSEQLTEYNDKVMKDLQKLIDKNEKDKKELAAKKEELKKLQANLESEKERIEQEISGIEGTVPSTKGQIKLYQDRVNYYKNKGCKSNDVIGVTCDIPPKVTKPSYNGNISAGAVIGPNGFRYPVDGGRISWAYGGRHKGVDITRGCGVAIHPVAPGTVYYVGNNLDNYGAYMVMIVHNVNGRLVFSQYAHVQSNIPVRVGQAVDVNSTIAYMGTTGYSTGCHLHLEMSEYYGWGYNTKYNIYTSHIINPFKYVPRP